MCKKKEKKTSDYLKGKCIGKQTRYADVFIIIIIRCRKSYFVQIIQLANMRIYKNILGVFIKDRLKP